MAIRVTNVTAQFFFNPTTRLRSVSNTLNLQDEAEKRALNVHNVTFQALIPATPTLGATASDTILFDEVTIFLNSVGERQIPVNDLGFSDIASAQGQLTNFNTLMFTQSLLPGLYDGIAGNGLGLSQGTHHCFGPTLTGYFLEHALELGHTAGEGRDASATNALSFLGVVEEREDMGNFLNLFDLAEAGRSILVQNNLTFDQTFQAVSAFGTSITQMGLVTQAFTYYVENNSRPKAHEQFEGEGQAVSEPTNPRLQFDSDFVLETLTGPKMQLRLRSPETDDIDRLGFNRVNRETRGGELGVFSDPNWAQVNTLLFTIVALKPDTLIELQEFMRASLGQEIILQDWTGTFWKGVITTPDESAVEDAEGFWTISFEFEGEAFEGSAEDQSVTFTDAIGLQVDYTRSAFHDLSLTDSSTAGGDINLEEESDNLLFQDPLIGILATRLIFDNFDGAAVPLNATIADVGGTWNAHPNFQADGTITTPINSGAYLPFVPVNGTRYECIWRPRGWSDTGGAGQELRFFISEGQPSSVSAGLLFDGSSGDSSLKAGFILRSLGGSGNESHLARMGDSESADSDGAVFSDGSIGAMGEDLDLRLDLDTTGGTNNWTVTWFAKHAADDVWIQVRPTQGVLDELIGGIGFASDNTTETFSMSEISVTEEVIL